MINVIDLKNILMIKIKNYHFTLIIKKYYYYSYYYKNNNNNYNND